MRDLGESTTNHSGSILVAQPGLEDPNFRKTVILISEHKEEGALGIVINRPLKKTLGEYKEEFASGPLAEVPLYSGGPVGKNILILTAWKWEHEIGMFKLYFGLDPDKAQSLLAEEPDLEVRGFLGYAGWKKGQIEDELSKDAWIVLPIDGNAIENLSETELWRQILASVSPRLEIEADAPEDPSLN